LLKNNFSNAFSAKNLRFSGLIIRKNKPIWRQTGDKETEGKIKGYYPES